MASISITWTLHAFFSLEIQYFGRFFFWLSLCRFFLAFPIFMIATILIATLEIFGIENADELPGCFVFWYEATFNGFGYSGASIIVDINMLDDLILFLVRAGCDTNVNQCSFSLLLRTINVHFNPFLSGLSLSNKADFLWSTHFLRISWMWIDKATNGQLVVGIQWLVVKIDYIWR